MTNCILLGRGQVMWPITKFWGSNHITGTAEPKVVKFCTRVGNIKSMKQDDTPPTKGAWLLSRDCFKILPLVVMQSGFVSDSWATCKKYYAVRNFICSTLFFKKKYCVVAEKNKASAVCDHKCQSNSLINDLSDIELINCIVYCYWKLLHVTITGHICWL